jgi:hypothetical protein
MKPGENLQYVSITYGDATGPLKMKMDTVEDTGIHIGEGQDQGNRRIYEFIIEFKSAPCLSAIRPGMSLGIGIVSANAQPQGPPGGPGGNGGAPTGFGPGGGLGGPGAGAGPGQGAPPGRRGGFRGPSLKLWLNVKLETMDAHGKNI